MKADDITVKIAVQFECPGPLKASEITVDGWYWWRRPNNSLNGQVATEIVWIDVKEDAVYISGSSYASTIEALRTEGGDLYGPLVPPWEQK